MAPADSAIGNNEVFIHEECGTGMEKEVSERTKARARKRRREILLDKLFQPHSAPESDKKKVKHVYLDERAMENVAFIKELHYAETWRFLPEEVVEIMFRSKSPYKEFVKSEKVEDIPANVVVSMALELLSMYLWGANPYNREQMRRWFSIDGNQHKQEVMQTMMLNAALLERDMRAKEVEDAMEGGAPQSDNDFVFDD